MINVHKSSCMYTFFLSDCIQTWTFLGRFSKGIQISNLMKIRPVGDESFHAVGQRDMLKLIVAFRDFTNAPKNLCVLCACQKTQRLFPYTVLTSWFFLYRTPRCVFKTFKAVRLKSVIHNHMYFTSSWLHVSVVTDDHQGITTIVWIIISLYLALSWKFCNNGLLMICADRNT